MERIIGVIDRTVNITESTTIMPEQDYGAWFAINQGASTAQVLGYDLQPGEGLDMRHAVPAGAKWDRAIEIVVQPGGVVRLTRLQYRWG